MATLIKHYPEFGELYWLKEDFRNIFASSETKAEAGERYNAWIRAIPNTPVYRLFPTFCNSINRWKAESFNYFDDPIGARFSNGSTEATIGVIKNIMQSGYGYSFEALRGKVIYGESRVDRKTGSRKTQGSHGRSYRTSCMEFMSGDFSDAIMSDVHALLSSDVPYLSKIKEAFGDHSPAKLYKLLNANNNVSAPFLIVADALDSSVEERGLMGL